MMQTPSANLGGDAEPFGRAPEARWIRLLPLLMVMTFILGILPNSGCGKSIFPAATTSATATNTGTATASPSSSASSTPTTVPIGSPFEMRGSGAQASPTPGTCSGQACAATQGNCECLQFSGSLLSTVVGNSNWTASLTVNLDDCTGTGTFFGICCVGDGLFRAINTAGRSAGVLDLSFTGQYCVDPNSSPSILLLGSSLQASFTILNSVSSGRFLNSTGTGQINISSDANGNAYLATEGEIQLVAP
jgi:hypothetical protein